jgi:hypothetical protein
MRRRFFSKIARGGFEKSPAKTRKKRLLKTGHWNNAGLLPAHVPGSIGIIFIAIERKPSSAPPCNIMTAYRWLLIALFPFLTACPGPQKSSIDPEQERDAVSQRIIIMGMKPESVIASWGKPDNVTTSKAGKVVTDQWYYASGMSVTFTDGFVSGFQAKPAPATPKRGDWMFKNYKNPLEKKAARAMH